jgi:hypothetical protein
MKVFDVIDDYMIVNEDNIYVKYKDLILIV